MDILQLGKELFDAYMAWRMAPVGVYMGIAPAIVAAAIMGGTTLASALLNRPSSQQRQALGFNNQLSRVQVDEQRRATELARFLEEIFKGQFSEPPGLSSDMQLNLGSVIGQGDLVPDSLISAIAPGIQQQSALDSLMGLVSPATGTGAVAQGFQDASIARERRGQENSEAISQLVQMLLQRSYAGSGGSAGGLAPAFPGNFTNQFNDPRLNPGFGTGELLNPSSFPDPS
jgi:hypothetical protein